MTDGRARVLLVLLLLAAGLAGTGGGATVLSLEMTGHATTAQAAAAGQQEVATLWERLPAGQIFPRRVPYENAISYRTQASLVGIAPSSSCAAATDRRVAAVLSSAGCVAMLRATYTDATGTVIATVGVAVLGSARAASGAFSAISGSTSAGLHAVSFPGTASSNFTDGARETYGAGARGPYLVMYTAGYADGRRTVLDSSAPENPPDYLGTSLQDAVGQRFIAPSRPCENRFISC